MRLASCDFHDVACQSIYEIVISVAGRDGIDLVRLPIKLMSPHFVLILQ